MPRITNPLPQLVPDRLNRLVYNLRQQIWSRSQDLEVTGGPTHAKPVSLADAGKQQFSPVGRPERFGPPLGQWHQRWFQVVIPPAQRGEKGRRYLHWICSGEANAYLNGVPYAGIDGVHQTCPLPDEACTLWIDVGLYMNGGIWGPEQPPATKEGALFDSATLKVRNETAWQAYWDTECLNTLIRHQLREQQIELPGVGFHTPHDRLSALTRQLVRRADELCDIYDREGLAALAKASAKALTAFPPAAWEPVAALCGHAHIDAVWLWPEWVTQRKVIHTFSTQVRLMERYPEFVFSQSQPVFIRWVKQQAPGLYRQIQKRVREGRWEFTGAFEVEPDTNLPCGEALARSIVMGQQCITELRGEPAALCWLPDVFGYSAALPQILKLSGVEQFYTTKMSWSSVTKFPYNSFVWRGVDGSEVVTMLCPVNYNGNCDLPEIETALRDHRQADVFPEMILPTGVGDGGGGPADWHIERSRRYRSIAGVPKMQWKPAEEVMGRLAQIRETLPVYQGELYLEYHRGTYTTQSQYKLAYRTLERSLQTHEAARVAIGGKPLGQETWLRLAFGQFHDALPGSSISAVYEQMVPEFRELAEKELAATEQELSGAGKSAGTVVFNPLAMERTVAVIESDKPVLVKLPPLGTAALEASEPMATVEAVEASARRLKNGIVDAKFDVKGRLAGLTIRGRRIELAGPAELRLYCDEPHGYDAWDIDQQALKLPTGSVAFPSLKVVASGPARAVLAGEAKLGEKSTIQVQYLLDAASEHLRCVVKVDWHEDHRLLKFHLPTAYRGKMAWFGAPFGAIQRPQLPGVPADEAQWEVPGNRWAAVVDDSLQGAAIITEAKYGFSCKEGDLALSLLRSPKHPDPNADMGQHEIRFAIGAYTGVSSDQSAATAACADLLFTPPVVVKGGKAIASPFSLSELGSLVPAWVVPSATGYTIRLHEVSGGRGMAKLTLAKPAKAVVLTDLLGRELAKARRSGSSWDLPYTPYQVVSVAVTQ